MRRLQLIGLIFLLLLMLPTLASATLPFGEQWREQLIGNFGGVDRRVGYGRNATGGAGGTLCTVTNLNDSGAGSLRNCLNTPGAQWIIFSVSGTIQLNAPALGDPQVPPGPDRADLSNKTIDGRGANITIVGPTTGGIPALQPSGVYNWIVHDVTLHAGSGFLVRILCGVRMWFDHIDLTGGINTVVSFGMGSDGGYCPNVVTGETIATEITLSYFHTHDRCWVLPYPDASCGSGMFLIGQSDATEGNMINARLTMHHNWHEHSAANRFPNVRWARAHVFNNYIENTNQGSQIITHAQLRSENEIWDCSVTYGDGLDCGVNASIERYHCNFLNAGQNINTTSDNCYATGTWKVAGTETYNEQNPGTIFNPALDYSYTLETADAALKAKLMNPTTGAGAVSNPYNYLGTTATDDLVGWWKLDEPSGTTATDSSTHGFTGTLVNMESPGDWVQGLIGNVAGKGALQFDGPVASGGTNEYVTIPDNDILSPVTTGEFSICAWVRIPSAPTDFATIVGKGIGSNYEYAFDLDSTQHVVFVLWPASGSPTHASATSSATVSVSAWTHVCGTYTNAVAVNVYVNGVNSGTSTSFTGVMTNGTSPVNIGRRPDDIEYLNARVDDVRIFNYALNGAEVLDIMAEGFDVVYHLDEVASPANDSGQPGAYDGTWVASPTPVIPGKLNNALNFNGSTQYVSVPTSPSLLGAVSIALWVKPSSLATVGTVLSNQLVSGGPTQAAVNISATDGSWSYLYDAGTGARGFVSSGAAPITTGNWVHLALTDDGAGTVVLYQSGAAISQTNFGTPTTKPPTAPGPLAIGRRGDGIQYFNGAVDEVHLVSRVMSAGEILALAQEGSDTTPPAAPTSLRVVSP